MSLCNIYDSIAGFFIFFNSSPKGWEMGLQNHVGVRRLKNFESPPLCPFIACTIVCSFQVMWDYMYILSVVFGLWWLIQHTGHNSMRQPSNDGFVVVNPTWQSYVDSNHGLFFIFRSLLPIFSQVGCMPWVWSTNSSSSIVIISPGGTNKTMSELPCDAAHYAFLSCVVGTLTLAIFLRVSSLPKMILLLFVTILYIVILELSGYQKAMG